MQGIREICSCIYRSVTHLFAGTGHNHTFQCAQDFLAGIFFIQLLFKCPVYYKGDKACDEMGTDVVFCLKIYRTGPEAGLHNPETFLNLPAFLIDSYNLIYSHVVKVRTYGIETIIAFLFLNGICIQVNPLFGADFPVFRCFISGYKPVGIILVFGPLLVVPAVNKLQGPFHLPVPDFPLVVFIFQ